MFSENDKIGIEKNFAKWFEDLNLTPASEETMEGVEIPTTSSADIFAFSWFFVFKTLPLNFKNFFWNLNYKFF